MPLQPSVRQWGQDAGGTNRIVEGEWSGELVGPDQAALRTKAPSAGRTLRQDLEQSEG